MASVDRTLAEWMEVSLWPGVSSDHRLDEFRRRTRVRRPDGTFEDAPTRQVPLATVTAHEPETAHVVPSAGTHRPLVIGSGEVDLTCAECSFTVCESVGEPAHFIGLGLECPGCGALQRVAAAS